MKGGGMRWAVDRVGDMLHRGAAYFHRCKAWSSASQRVRPTEGVGKCHATQILHAQGRVSRRVNCIRNGIRARWQQGGWTRLALALEILVGAIAIAKILLVLYLFVSRLSFPFELEWMEGGIMDHVRVLLAGQPLYQRPSLSFTPYIYTPFYYAVGAAFCLLFGTNFFALRLVSVVATVLSVLLIASFVQRESRDPLAVIIAAAWFLAAYGITGFWLDLARVDALFLFLLLTATWLAQFGKGSPSALAAGLVLFLSFFTKQSGLTFLFPLLALASCHGWKRPLLSSASFALCFAVTVASMNRITNGWFTFYVFNVSGQHAMLWDRWRPLLFEFFLGPIVVPLVFACFALLRGRLERRKRLAYASFAAIALASSYLSLLHQDGFVNVLIPGYAGLCIVAGIGFARFRHIVSDSPLRQPLLSLSAVAWLIAFATLQYDYRCALPTPRDAAAGSAMLDSLREQTGPILMPGSGYLLSAAGHRQTSAHSMALADVFKTREAQPKQELLNLMLTSIREKRWASIILANSFSMFPPLIEQEVRRHYRLNGSLYPVGAENDGWPRAGFRTRPDRVWVPRD